MGFVHRQPQRRGFPQASPYPGWNHPQACSGSPACRPYPRGRATVLRLSSSPSCAHGALLPGHVSSATLGTAPAIPLTLKGGFHHRYWLVWSFAVPPSCLSPGSKADASSSRQTGVLSTMPLSFGSLALASRQLHLPIQSQKSRAGHETNGGCMDDLTYGLRQLCRRNRDGSHATQADRLRGLTLVAQQLSEAGFRRMGTGSIKGKHVEALVERWQSEGLSTGRSRTAWRICAGGLRR